MQYPWRMRIVWLMLLVVAAGVVWRLVHLNITERSFLMRQGDARMVREVPIPAHRGMILDRRGEPLAVSAPVVSLWANPQVLGANLDQAKQVATALGLPEADFLERLEHLKNKEFMYLKRHVNPSEADTLLDHGWLGVHGRREFHRYYPSAEVATHLVGFNNVDDQGQEGLELGYESWLQGASGAKMVQKDRTGRTVKDLKLLAAGQPGKDLVLSIDMRMQYVAYRELKAVVQQHHAASGSVVVLDVATGEILAMVNQPAYNPNNRAVMSIDSLRNRAMTDVFEPGSTMKPVTIAAALMSGQYDPDSQVDTSPGFIKVKRKTIRDHRNYGVLDITGIITKSSNVGVTKLALSLPENSIRDTFYSFGLGQSTGTGFPGESAGILPNYAKWNPINLATMSYGYGIAVTPLQLAQAYNVFASYGLKRPISMLKQETELEAERVMPERVAKQVIAMLETVTQRGGTGTRAQVPSYRVAGKTGTVHRTSKQGGYDDDRYAAVFAGMAPASKPRLVCVVIVDDPKGEQYYGGEVAAPVFSRIMAESLRLLNVAPDNLLPLQG
ncbi:MAG: penicillin-binding protein 2 [Oceanospirillaceae bacterium]|mgnify:FL=1|jgi:cell division protein FtsI (penicillin-binding protein 3)|nr:penicillin-binding protein 2 [Oceanospirillaceae bacterium]MBT4443255.1 penicillin-binding protein 2 [Oceanospirillaceae bacterium]MBT6077563.1 penicillin-binding protein 2 [Oceanospirillaceae bacterium]MBT7330520.1 penicillin-binding protein 2 [Oceanospirillaceae bacterium]